MKKVTVYPAHYSSKRCARRGEGSNAALRNRITSLRRTRDKCIYLHEPILQKAESIWESDGIELGPFSAVFSTFVFVSIGAFS